MAIKTDYAKGFGQLANIVTGFAVTQTLVLMITLASEPSAFGDHVEHHRTLVIALVAMFHSLYGLAVWKCHGAERRLLPTEDQHAIGNEICWLSIAQMTIIALFGATLIYVVELLPRQMSN